MRRLSSWNKVLTNKITIHCVWRESYRAVSLNELRDRSQVTDPVKAGPSDTHEI